MTPPVPNSEITPFPWESRPAREILRLAWPGVVSLTSFSLMSLVDTLFVGRLGATALAGAGLGGVFAFTIASFGLGVISAAKVDVARLHGSGDTAQVQRSLGAFLRIAFILGFISTVIAQLLATALPMLPNVGENTGRANEYLAARSLGFPCVLGAAAIGQWLQAQGDSRSAMRAALVANIANAPLNYLLIFTFDLGLLGAGLATALARSVEFAWLFRQKSLITLGRPTNSMRQIWANSSLKEAALVLQRGTATGLERVLDMIAFAMVPLLLASVGAAHVAAHQIVLQISMFSFLPILALSDAISVLVSQALGANRRQVLRTISGLGFFLSLAYSSLCAVVAGIFASTIASLFTPDMSVIAVTRATLFVMGPLLVIHGAYGHLKGVLRGFRQFNYVAWVTIACSWAVTPPLTYVLAVHRGWGAVGAWHALCAEVALGVLLLAWRLRRTLSPQTRETSHPSQVDNIISAEDSATT